MRRVIEFKQLIFVAKSKGHKQRALQTDDMEIRYDCAKRYHVLYKNCAKDIPFGLSDYELCLTLSYVYLYPVFFLLFVCLLLYVPSHQLWSWRDGQFT